MDPRIFKNSYIVAFLTFIILCIIFYIFGIGYQTKVEDGKVVKKFSWRYPLALALVVWVIWYFWIYPPAKNKQIETHRTVVNITGGGDKSVKYNNLSSEKRINMNDWN